MSAFDVIGRWLAGKPSRNDPPPAIPRFETDIVHDDAAPEPDETGDPESFDGYLEPIFVGIEYRASTGATTRRQITMTRIERTAAGDSVLIARCHLRNMPRAFRCDRIAAFIDAGTGEISEPGDFWREIGLDPTALAGRPAVERAPAEPSDRAPRRPTLKTRLNVLAAMSRCDGHMNEAEIDAILHYAAAETEADGAMMTAEQIDALRARIARMRPTREALEVAVAKLFQGPHRLEGRDWARFLRAAREVADADGELRPEEFDLLAALERGEL